MPVAPVKGTRVRWGVFRLQLLNEALWPFGALKQITHTTKQQQARPYQGRWNECLLWEDPTHTGPKKHSTILCKRKFYLTVSIWEAHCLILLT